MSTALNLQRNSEVYVSTVDLASGAAATTMTPSNTWKLEVLAGFAVTASSATQDITSLESGLDPDRSQQRFNTAVNPVDWNLQVYLRPTGAESTAATGANVGLGSNARPVADWFMWQSLVSNTRPSTGTAMQSAWQNGGILRTTTVAAAANTASSKSNFAVPSEMHMYFKLDNVIYQVANSSVGQATVDAGIEEIATVTWTGQGLSLKQLIGTNKTNAEAVFKTANANATNITAAASYHPYNQTTVNGSLATNSFIKNRLSTIQINYDDGSGNTAFTLPVTALSFDYNNNLTYLSPEELNTLNTPIGSFVGTRAVTGSATMYLRVNDNESAGLMRKIINDTRTTSAQSANANLIIGGTTAPYVSFFMPAVQFDFPQTAIEDVIAVSVNFVAQEPTATKGDGGEVVISAKK